MSELGFKFIDAVIAGDMELAYKIALEYEQGEQVSFLGGLNDDYLFDSHDGYIRRPGDRSDKR